MMHICYFQHLYVKIPVSSTNLFVKVRIGEVSLWSPVNISHLHSSINMIVFPFLSMSPLLPANEPISALIMQGVAQGIKKKNPSCIEY